MDLQNAQEAFVTLLGHIEPSSKLKFLEWVHCEYNPISADTGMNGNIPEQEDSDLIDEIASFLRSSINPTNLAVGEGQTQADGNPVTPTLHVDSFLYPEEEDVDGLLKILDIGRYHCIGCGSWKTAPLEFISHSISKEEIKFIFMNLVPNLSGKVVVDVGSRLGPILYGGYVYSQASQLIGIEKDPSFCKLQEETVSKYNLFDRIRVVCSDVCQQQDLLQLADLVVLNNVFEYFCSKEEQADIWEFLFRTLRKRGTLIVTTPSIQECCKQLTFKATLHLDDWVKEVDIGLVPHEDLADIHLYCVV